MIEEQSVHTEPVAPQTQAGVILLAGARWYSSHGSVTSLAEIYELEVEERENYTPQEFQSWIASYGLTMEMDAIWGTTYETARRYCDNEDDEPYELVPKEYGVRSFIVITESDDGDDGFLLVLKEGY